MKTQFQRALTPREAYAAKLRWIIASLLAVIVVLIISFVSFVAEPGTDQKTAEAPKAVLGPPEQAVASPLPDSATVRVLVARKRIEAGSELKEYQFLQQSVPKNLVPEGVLLAADRTWLAGKYAKHLVNANSFVSPDDVTETRPFDPLNIPDGYRAVTILVNARTSVEGLAKPNSRVDVLWVYTHPNGSKGVATIVRFAKVLSIGGVSHEGEKVSVKGGGTTATLLVTERDAKMIELARATGDLSLSLVGGNEAKNGKEQQDNVSMKDLLQKIDAFKGEDQPSFDGVFWTVDPSTSQRVRYVLERNRWQRDLGEEQESAEETGKSQRRARMRYLPVE